MESALPKFDGWKIDRRTCTCHGWCQLIRRRSRILFVQRTSLGHRLRVWIWMCCLQTTLRSLLNPHDISVTLLCGSEDGHTPVNSDQVLSDEDLQTAAGSSDQRQVFRTHYLSPVEWYSRWSVSVGYPQDSPDEWMQHFACVQTSAPEVRPKANNQRLSAAGPSPVVGPVDTEDIPLVTTGLPGCPYRITSYNGLALSDMNPAFGLQLYHRWFLEFIGAPVFGSSVLLAGGALQLYECNIVLLIYLHAWLKCYFSGCALQGSGSILNPI